MQRVLEMLRAGGLGLAGIHVPEEYGGQGFGQAEPGIALEEAGRALLCAPLLGSAALAANSVLCAATDTSYNFV